jgi:integrase
MREGEPGPTVRDTWLRERIRVAGDTVPKVFKSRELLNPQWGNVDLESDRLVVRNRDGFTAKNGRRTGPLRGDALETLREMNEARSPLGNEPVFVDADGDPPKPDWGSRRFKFYVRKAKLSRRKELSTVGTQRARGCRCKACRSV